MKNFAYYLFFSLCVISFTSCSKDSMEEMEIAELTTEIPPISYSNFETEVLELVNIYRTEKGLSQLIFLDEISHQASNHNNHMIEKDEVCHHEFGKRFSALVNTVEADAVSENVAYGYRTADAVVQAWIKSKGHRENMEGKHT